MFSDLKRKLEHIITGYDMIYDAWFALENWQASCPFNLAHKLKRTENVLKGNETRETKMEVLLRKTLQKIQKQMVVREIEAWDQKK